MDLIVVMQKACQKLIDSDGADSNADLVVRGIIDHEISPTGEIFDHLQGVADLGAFTSLYLTAEANCLSKIQGIANDIALAVSTHVYEQKMWLAPEAIIALFDGKKDTAGWLDTLNGAA